MCQGIEHQHQPFAPVRVCMCVCVCSRFGVCGRPQFVTMTSRTQLRQHYMTHPMFGREGVDGEHEQKEETKKTISFSRIVYTNSQSHKFVGVCANIVGGICPQCALRVTKVNRLPWSNEVWSDGCPQICAH